MGNLAIINSGFSRTYKGYIYANAPMFTGANNLHIQINNKAEINKLIAFEKQVFARELKKCGAI